MVEAHLKDTRDAHRSHRPNMHVIESYYDSSNDESKKCCVTKFVWPTQNKSVTCSSHKPVQKNRQEDIKFTPSIPKKVMF